MECDVHGAERSVCYLRHERFSRARLAVRSRPRKRQVAWNSLPPVQSATRRVWAFCRYTHFRNPVPSRPPLGAHGTELRHKMEETAPIKTRKPRSDKGKSHGPRVARVSPPPILDRK